MGAWDSGGKFKMDAVVDTLSYARRGSGRSQPISGAPQPGHVHQREGAGSINDPRPGTRRPGVAASHVSPLRHRQEFWKASSTTPPRTRPRPSTLHADASARRGRANANQTGMFDASWLGRQARLLDHVALVAFPNQASRSPSLRIPRRPLGASPCPTLFIALT
jgi:hypothetical protein